MSKPKQTPLTPEMERRIASRAHWLACDGLSRDSNLGLDALVFQGGTCLSMAWGSPRFSEDLDFLLAREAAGQIEQRMQFVGRHVERGLQLDWPGAKVSVRARLRDDNPNALFRLTIDVPGVLGNVLVKVEFWRVPGSQISPYLRTHTALRMDGHPAIIAGAAKPEQILVDKLLALAHRERLKWRDLFDLWFLRQTHPEAAQLLREPGRLGQLLLDDGRMYDKDGDDTAEGLSAFLHVPVSEVVGRAEQGLKPWLAPSLWTKMWPATVEEMVTGAREAALVAREALIDSQPRPAPSRAKP